MEVVFFRTRCGRSAREGGIPQGIHERSIRGSIGVGKSESTREDSHEHTAEPILRAYPYVSRAYPSDGSGAMGRWSTPNEFALGRRRRPLAPSLADGSNSYKGTRRVLLFGPPILSGGPIRPLRSIGAAGN